MKIHEFQAKELFRQAGVAVLEGFVAKTAQEAGQAYDKLGGEVAVIKAQIHAGGRGKGTFKENPSQHGVQLVRSREEVVAAAEAMLGNTLVTIQTGPEGKVVNQVFVEAGCDIDRELYLGIVMDRGDDKRPVMMASNEGGVEIEKVAAETPEKIFKEHFDPSVGIESFQVRTFCKKLGIEGPAVRSMDKFMKTLSKVFVEKDCAIAEINPLVLTKDGQVIALDAKMSFDENAMYRHPELVEYRDLSEEDPSEIKANEAGLSFVNLDGNIGCLVNGAGLAMSTMDIIKLHGGEPANFLDVGGGANVDQVTEAFNIILEDKNVKAVLVNIFGGIMQCTTIANAILEAYEKVGFNIPLVVRLEGTEVEEGRKLLSESKVDIISAEGLTNAAKKVVEAAGALTV
ncbi:MAG: ADP-forming succinate--CoA ligase subunit beta [Pirellulaceae bacterium]|nr:ADP-forming succinate--CoA ligase subunit beta [Pirellulaceae bacterium]